MKARFDFSARHATTVISFSLAMILCASAAPPANPTLPVTPATAVVVAQTTTPITTGPTTTSATAAPTTPVPPAGGLMAPGPVGGRLAPGPVGGKLTPGSPGGVMTPGNTIGGVRAGQPTGLAALTGSSNVNVGSNPVVIAGANIVAIPGGTVPNLALTRALGGTSGVIIGGGLPLAGSPGGTFTNFIVTSPGGVVIAGAPPIITTPTQPGGALTNGIGGAFTNRFPGLR